MPDAAPTITNIGTTQYRRFVQGSQTFTIQVQQVSGKVAAHYASSMQVDADGAPKGYHQGDQRPYQNNHDCFDWLENLSPSDQHGQQGIDGAIGPAQGFTISATSLCDTSVTNKRNTARYVDASTIPFIVMPAHFPTIPGAHKSHIVDCLGCLCYVINLKTGNATGAVFADIGPHVGEASLATALRLGCDPFYPNARPKVAGMDSKRFFTIVFPNEILNMPLAVDAIETQAKAQFEAWGGWDGLAAVLKQVPKESPHTAPDDDIATLTLPPPKGPVVQEPVVATAAARPLAAGSNAALLDSPNGKRLAPLTAGTPLVLVEALPHGDWLRVFATVDGELTQGYIAATATAQQ